MKTRITILVVSFPLFLSVASHAAELRISGRVTDPQGKPLAGANVQLTRKLTATTEEAKSDNEGRFQFQAIAQMDYLLCADAAGFQQASKTVTPFSGSTTFDVQLQSLAVHSESITVTARVAETSITSPDPGETVFVRQELLDANPGRPGAPVSIPGMPIETASGGIKAPQYFVPGVAGDHGEPIAQYIAVGTYLVPNNLSANAHGNGYADPNILAPQVIDSVQVDAGAFNVLEGNHSLNLAAAYGLRPRIDPFLTVTSDFRDIDVTAGFAPSNPETHAWLMMEAAYGNGSLQRLEHREQYKLNGLRAFAVGAHEMTLMGIGYYGFSYVPGLAPIEAPDLRDNIDPRQKDQTHTAELIANDEWKPSISQQLRFSVLFRTYNLALFSNFGQQASNVETPLAQQLIRQSEFRTVEGASASYIHHLSEYISFLAGIDYDRDAPRRDDLDRYNQSKDFNVYGPFQKITSNNITINDAAPYAALNGEVARHLRYYLGFRRDEIGFNNHDLLTPMNSFDHISGVNNPKATLSYVPSGGSWLPTAALSWGESFFTNDPRIGIGESRGTLVERAHSYQLVVDKLVRKTDLRLTLGHVTTDATFGKIDPDTGLQEDEGPGRLRFLTALVRQRFNFGMLQASLSKADARDSLTGLPTPEAPRTIFDALGTFDRLPLRLQARSEFEYVGRKPLGDGFRSVPVKELRVGVVRSLLGERFDAGLNLMLANGYTGQTTETLALPDETMPFERVVGVRLASYVGISISYHFQSVKK
jgi:hypothetical protein